MPSAEQFNIGVQWKPEAYRALENIGYANRVGLGHTNEHGLSYHADSVGLHLLFGDQDPTRGHAHVDYRYGSISDMLGFGEGHFQPYNSDVRAIGPELDGAGRRIDNFERHSKWFAPIPGFIR